MTSQELVAAARAVFGKRLTAEQAGQLLEGTIPMHVKAGGIALREGERSKGLLLLVRGTVEILAETAKGESLAITTVTAPTVVGEMALVRDVPHATTVRAQTHCDFQLLPTARFESFLAADSLAAYKLVAAIAEVLARRLELMDRKVAELTDRKNASPPVEELAVFKQKLFSEWRF